MPLPRDELDVVVTRVATDTGLPDELVREIARRESAFDEKRKKGRYRGLWQVDSRDILADYNKRFKLDIQPDDLYDPEVNADVVTWVWKLYKRGLDRVWPVELVPWTSKVRWAAFYWGWLAGWSNKAGVTKAYRKYVEYLRREQPDMMGDEEIYAPHFVQSALDAGLLGKGYSKHLLSKDKRAYAERSGGRAPWIPRLPDEPLPDPTPRLPGAGNLGMVLVLVVVVLLFMKR